MARGALTCLPRERDRASDRGQTTSLKNSSATIKAKGLRVTIRKAASLLPLRSVGRLSDVASRVWPGTPTVPLQTLASARQRRCFNACVMTRSQRGPTTLEHPKSRMEEPSSLIAATSSSRLPPQTLRGKWFSRLCRSTNRDRASSLSIIEAASASNASTALVRFELLVSAICSRKPIDQWFCSPGLFRATLEQATGTKFHARCIIARPSSLGEHEAFSALPDVMRNVSATDSEQFDVACGDQVCMPLH